MLEMKKAKFSDKIGFTFMNLVLKYMSRYDSMRSADVLKTVKQNIECFEYKLNKIVEHPYMGADILRRYSLLKNKYYIYAAFLAAISSYPILYRATDQDTIRKSIFSKTAMVTSIKLLDNINDSHHTFEEAVKSQQRYLQALTSGEFNFCLESDKMEWVHRAENTAHLIATWAYDSMADCSESLTFKMFVEDVDEYIEGQIASFYQKRDKYLIEQMTLADFLNKVSSKCFGKPWIDIDFCFYERTLHSIDNREVISLRLINKSLDMIFKSLLFYDDITDLNEDVENGIINTTMMLGLDSEKIIAKDLDKGNSYLIKKLEKEGVIEDAMNVGNMLYLGGIDYLKEAKMYTSKIDIDALIFCSRVLRMFLLRKFVAEKKNLQSLRIFFQSLSSFEKIRSSIPPHLASYNKMANVRKQLVCDQKHLNPSNDERALPVA